jgi:hypothetical protein
MNEIPTPETDEAWKTVSRTPDGMYDSRVPIKEYAYAMSNHAKDLERRLTVAREALIVVANHSSSTRLLRISREALTATAPKQ